MTDEIFDVEDIPRSPYLSTPETVENDLRKVEEARKKGITDIPIEEVFAELNRIIQ